MIPPKHPVVAVLDCLRRDAERLQDKNLTRAEREALLRRFYDRLCVLGVDVHGANRLVREVA